MYIKIKLLYLLRVLKWIEKYINIVNFVTAACFNKFHSIFCQIKFVISQMTVSGLRVNRLDMYGEV